MQSERLQYLLRQWLDEASTQDEERELKLVLSQKENDNAFADLLQQFVMEPGVSLNSDNWELRVNEILNVDKQVVRPVSIKDRSIPPVHRVHFLKTTWLRYAAAVLILLGIGTWLFFMQSSPGKEQPVLAAISQVKPGSDRAILTLSGGRQIILDSTYQLISDGQISINQQNGVITYNPVLTPGNLSSAYNTMNTPRGGQYQLVLPDGSKVWLNSASSLKYPVTFTGKERIVELTGEAYFDIKKNKEKPFFVKTSKVSVAVLGTEFNINAYEDEPSSATTLIQGSVKVSIANDAKTILPGQQVLLSTSQPNNLEIKNNVDISQVIAWQKGIFEFKDASLDIVARQLSRWYDIEIVVGANNKNIKFSGGITKKTPLETLLKILETNGVMNKRENNVITLYSSNVN